VYFDDLKIVHEKTTSSLKVVQGQDYYPFGLTFNSYSRENSVANQYLYNGKQKQEEFGLDWLDFGARMYMPEIGRWEKVDALSDKYEAISPYTYALNDPVNAIDPDGNLVIFVNGFMPNQWLNRDNNKTIDYRYRADPGVEYIVQNPNYMPYPGERTFSEGSPTYLGKSFAYWGNETNTKAGVGGLFSQAFNDYNTRFISASSDNNSQAQDRFSDGQKAGEDLVRQLDAGTTITLGENETIKIVGHSQGAAFAAGIVSILAKHEKYSSRIEVVYYLAPHQPGNFENPANIDAHQWSTFMDWVTDGWNLIHLFNGGSSDQQIKGVKNGNYHLRNSTPQKLGGHYVDSYLDDLARYFRKNGVKVTVTE